MLVVNFFGGPGSGKSTTAAGVFAQLKMSGCNCEYVPEYAKDLTWEGRRMDNQVLIPGKQYHRLHRLKGQVDIAVTDAPILLTRVYCKEPESLRQLATDLHRGLENLNFFVKRVKRYATAGRSQTEEEAKKIDELLLSELYEMSEPFETVTGNEAGIADVVHRILGLQPQ